jgi:hypothetical protein
MALRFARRYISFKKELIDFLNESSTRKVQPSKVLYKDKADQAHMDKQYRNAVDILRELRTKKMERMWIHLKNERLQKLINNEAKVLTTTM